MGENQNQPFQLSFNPSLRVDFQGSRVTSDGGLVLVRELDERLGFSDLIARHLTDSRAKNTQLPLADLLRQSIYSRMAGYEDVNDAERLAQDPTFRLIGSHKIWERGAALTSRSGEDGGTAGEIRPLLLAGIGRELSDEAIVWQYAQADRRAVASGGIAGAVGAGEIDPGRKRGRRGV